MWKVIIESKFPSETGWRKFILDWYKTKREAQLVADQHNEIFPTCRAYVEKK